MCKLLKSLVCILLLPFGCWAATCGAGFYLCFSVFAVCIDGLKIMGNIVFSIIWLLILIFIGFWIAGIAAGLYILLLPFSVCINPLTGLTDFLLKVVQFPRYCAESMVEGRGFN